MPDSTAIFLHVLTGERPDLLGQILGAGATPHGVSLGSDPALANSISEPADLASFAAQQPASPSPGPSQPPSATPPPAVPPTMGGPRPGATGPTTSSAAQPSYIPTDPSTEIYSVYGPPPTPPPAPVPPDVTTEYSYATGFPGGQTGRPDYQAGSSGAGAQFGGIGAGFLNAASALGAPYVDPSQVISPPIVQPVPSVKV